MECLVASLRSHYQQQEYLLLGLENLNIGNLKNSIIH